MNSTSPPPPKQGGSGPFIVAAIVMLLLMGGLIYWKLGGGNEEKPAPTAPMPVATTPPVLEEPPPPPPPAEEPKQDAGVAPKTTKRVASTGGGCAGECRGEASGNLRSMLSAKGGQSRGCYERALRQNNMLSGRIKLSLRIGPSGQVCSGSVSTNELGDPGVASCVLQMFKASTFPAPQGGCVDVEVPLRFEPKK